MGLVVSAADILAATPKDNDASFSLGEFVDLYCPLAAAGLTRRKVGEQLGLSESAVAGRLLRARRRGLVGGGRLPSGACGTVAAYRRHRRRGEVTDAACRRANAVYQQARTGPARTVAA